MRPAAILAIIAVLPFGAKASSADLKCTFKTPVVEMRSLADLPPQVAEYIVSHGKVPLRRLLRSGRQNSLWFVWLAVRGAPQRIEVFDFYRGHASLIGSDDIVAGKNPCEATERMLKNSSVERLLDSLPE